MGEYAEDHFRREVKSKFGFDPGPNEKQPRKTQPEKVHCPKCQKRVKAVGLQDHMRTVHHSRESHEQR